MKSGHTISTKSWSLLTLQWILIQDYGLKPRHYLIYFFVLDFFPFLWISICLLLGTTFSYGNHFSYHFISKRFWCLLLLEIDDLKLIHSRKLSCVFITAEKVEMYFFVCETNSNKIIFCYFKGATKSYFTHCLLLHLKVCEPFVRVLEKCSTLWSVCSFLHF